MADDETRTFHGKGGLSVYVPPKPPPKPDDWKLDFPPGFPPEVHYNGVKANYWVVLRERQMPYMGMTKRFTDEQMEWLESIKPDVEKLLPY